MVREKTEFKVLLLIHVEPVPADLELIVLRLRCECCLQQKKKWLDGLRLQGSVKQTHMHVHVSFEKLKTLLFQQL